MDYYKAVRLDKTSHYDKRTVWRMRRIVKADDPDYESLRACGRGIHCSPTLLDAVGYQSGPSIYCIVQPLNIIAGDDTKVRCDAVRTVRWLRPGEQDRLAGFKLWEANHPVNSFFLPTPQIEDKHKKWLDEWASVWASVGASVWASVWASVGASVWASVWASVGASVWASVRASVRASVGAYIGGLFPTITSWEHAESLGPDPWRPLLNLWYSGLVPSFDRKVWRLHGGRDAAVVYQRNQN